jgi:hypothetical protein
LEEYGVSMWALVGNWPTVGHDVERVAEACMVPPEAVLAALA